MWLVVGLGNPGAKYERNRHNIGFMAVDEIVRRHGFPGWRATKYDAVGTEGSIGTERVLALLPQTYMNESGRAVGPVARFYKIPPERVIVLHDELDLPAGKLRVKRGGGHGGHNGLRSLDHLFANDYWRVRLGIGHPGDKERVLGHVLGDFTKTDVQWLDPMLSAIAEHAETLLRDPAEFANKVHLTLNPPPPKPPAKPKPVTPDA